MALSTSHQRPPGGGRVGGSAEPGHGSEGSRSEREHEPCPRQSDGDQSDASQPQDRKDGRQAEPDVYERQLREIVAKLKATGSALVFATTTPVPEGGVRPHRDVADPERYNQIARKIMADNGVDVVDLYAFALARQKEIQPRVDVHFTKEGSAALGGEVATQIRARLAR